MKNFLKIAALVLCCAVVCGFLLLVAGGATGYWLWSASHPAPLAKDLSDGTLPLTFKTRSPALQAKLTDLAARKLLPNQYPPPAFAGASERLWDSFDKLFKDDSVEKLLEAADAFEEARTQEPRYSDWPTQSSSPEEVADFLKFVKFKLDGELAPFLMDEPFLRVDDFVDGLLKLRCPVKRRDDGNYTPSDLAFLCKIKFYVSLAEEKRPKALRMLAAMFRLARSPLAPGLDGERIRDAAASCASVMEKASALSGRERAALLALAKTEASRSFPSERIVAFERLDALAAFENSRAKSEGSVAASLDVLRDFRSYWEDQGFFGVLPLLEDLRATLSYNFDDEEVRELDLLDALERKGRLPEGERDAFLDSLKRRAALSDAEDETLSAYCGFRSRSEGCLNDLSRRLEASKVENTTEKM